MFFCLTSAAGVCGYFFLLSALLTLPLTFEDPEAGGDIFPIDRFDQRPPDGSGRSVSGSAARAAFSHRADTPSRSEALPN